MRAEEYGIQIGELRRGARNAITDVEGVRVGHSTLDVDCYKTGVTVILPCADNPYTRRLPAASFVLNGHGKTTGLLQIDELGTLETPIALTGTLNVGLVYDAMVEYMAAVCGGVLKTVNPVVCECNDSDLSRSLDRPVRKEHVFEAIHTANAAFAEGAVGGGTGLVCHGLKGGIGSASRMAPVDGATYTVGVLAQTNHGRLADLTINGERIGRRILRETEEKNENDSGSVIVIAATDAPLSDRQLKRMLRRVPGGLARLGSYFGQSSGDVFIGFSTCEENRVDIRDESGIQPALRLNEMQMNLFFRAVSEAVEEAALNSMLAAAPTTGFDGVRIEALGQYMSYMKNLH